MSTTCSIHAPWSFADGVLEATEGQGVDVVLNSLAGAAVARGIALLRPYGRFVELGKRDIYEGSRVELSPFRRNLSYFAVDLERAARERPAALGAILRELRIGSTEAISAVHRSR